MSFSYYNSGGTEEPTDVDAFSNEIDKLRNYYGSKVAKVISAASNTLSESGYNEYGDLTGIIGQLFNSWNNIANKMKKTITNMEEQHSREIDDYENQIAILSSTISSQNEREKRDTHALKMQLSQLSSRNIESNVNEDTEINKLHEQLTKQIRFTQEQEIEIKTLEENLNYFINDDPNTQYKTNIELNKKIGEQEKEILKLRWLTESLQNKNLNNTNIDEKKEKENIILDSKYVIDFSEFMDDDDELDNEINIDDENIFHENDNETGIDPNVQSMLNKALQMTTKVFNYTKQNGINFVSQNDNEEQEINDNNPFSSLKDITNTDLLVEELGTFNMLKKLKKKTFKDVFIEIHKDLKIGESNCEILNNIINEMMNENKEYDNLNDKFENNMNKHQFQQLKEYSNILIHCIKNISNDITNIKEFVHSDHKQVDILYHKMKELEMTMPYHDTKNLAIIGTIPKFINQQLQKLQKRMPKKIFSDEQLNEQEIIQECERIKNYESCINRVSDNIRNMNVTIHELRVNKNANFDVELEKLVDASYKIEEKLFEAKSFVHPTQSALIEAIASLIDVSIHNEELKRLLKLTEGELEAIKEELNIKRILLTKTKKEDDNCDNKPRRKTSVKFDSVDFDFMFKLDFEKNQFTESKNKITEEKLQEAYVNETQGNFNIDEIIYNEEENIMPKIIRKTSLMNEKIGQIENILSLLLNNDDSSNNDIKRMIKNISHEIKDIKEALNSSKNELNIAKKIMDLDVSKKYMSTLEKRYQEIRGLYKLKFAEVENQKDNLYQRDKVIESLKDYINEVEQQLRSVMSSAASNVENRMKAFNEMGTKIQTMEKTMGLIEGTFTNVTQACQDIQDSFDKDLELIIGDSFNDQQRAQQSDVRDNVIHACDYILKAFDDIGTDLEGVKQMIHPDFKMIEALQNELIKYKTSNIDDDRRQSIQYIQKELNTKHRDSINSQENENNKSRKTPQNSPKLHNNEIELLNNEILQKNEIINNLNNELKTIKKSKINETKNFKEKLLEIKKHFQNYALNLMNQHNLLEKQYNNQMQQLMFEHENYKNKVIQINESNEQLKQLYNEQKQINNKLISDYQKKQISHEILNDNENKIKQLELHYQEQINQLKNENEKLLLNNDNEIINALKKDKSNLSNKIKQYNKALIEVGSQLKNVADDVQKERKKNDKLTKKLNKYENEKIPKLKKELKSEKEALSNIKLMLTQNNTIKKLFESTKLEWEKTNENLLNDIEKYKKDIKQLKLQKLETINAYASELNKLRSVIKKLNGKVTVLQENQEIHEKMLETRSISSRNGNINEKQETNRYQYLTSWW